MLVRDQASEVIGFGLDDRGAHSGLIAIPSLLQDSAELVVGQQPHTLVVVGKQKCLKTRIFLQI